MSRAKILPTGFLFTNRSNNQANIEFSGESISVDKNITCLNGLRSSYISVGAELGSQPSTASISETTSFALKNETEGTVTLKADDATDTYTITLPSENGDTNTYLRTNADFSTSLQTAGNPIGLEHAWNFGTRKVYFAAIKTPASLANDFWLENTGTAIWKRKYPAANPVFWEPGQITLMQNVGVFTPDEITLNWDQTTSSIYWDMRFQTSVGNSVVQTAARGFLIYGNDTIENPDFSSVVGPARSTGICFEVSFHTTTAPYVQIMVYENGVLKQTFGPFNYDTWYFKITNNVGGYAQTSRSATVALEYELSEGFEPSGTRWGLGSYTPTASKPGPFIYLTRLEGRAI